MDPIPKRLLKYCDVKKYAALYILIRKHYLLIFLFISCDLLNAQDVARYYLEKHQSYIKGIVEVKKGNCSKASHLFSDHQKRLDEYERDHYSKKSDPWIIQCKQVNSPQIFIATTHPGQPAQPDRFRIKKERVKITLPSGKKEAATQVDRNISPEPSKAENTSSHDPDSYGVRFANRKEEDHSYLSLAELGTVISVENSGRYDYFVAHLKTETIAQKAAENLLKQGYKGVSVYTMKNGKPLSEIRKFEAEVKTGTISSDPCAVIIHSLKNHSKIESIKKQLQSGGHEVYLEPKGEFYRIGVKSSCEPEQLNILLEKMKRDYNSKAWIKK